MQNIDWSLTCYERLMPACISSKRLWMGMCMSTRLGHHKPCMHTWLLPDMHVDTPHMSGPTCQAGNSGSLLSGVLSYQYLLSYDFSLLSLRA